LVFLWLANSELAVLRVAERVRQGGHDIPKETVTRRYEKGLHNFFKLYQPIADSWYFYDNSNIADLKLIAKGKSNTIEKVFNEKIWQDLMEKYGKEK
ncbi:MAG TPA: hypothetical protein VK892_10425, partial [Pyrinomonadaceae bacterium]|nr:hypothetical protein [Pyrinomonadaceae bacterium]